MTKVVTLISLLVFIITNSAICQITRSEEEIAANPKDIVDYFLILPKFYYDTWIGSDTIFESRKKLIIENELREVTIDKSNAYLQIVDLTYELKIRITLTYFKKSNEEKVIGLSEYYEGGDCDTYKATFFKYKNHTWLDVTKEILPGISFQDFWGFEYPPDVEEYMDIDDNIDLDFELPQHGTNVYVTPQPFAALICFSYDLPPYVKWEKQYSEALNNREFEYIELEWNRESGTFSFRNK